MMNLLARFWREEEGQDLVEYALLLVFIALVVMVLLGQVGSSVNNVFSKANSALQGAS
jgi:Flp pilus assembly pilin Flp